MAICLFFSSRLCNTILKYLTLQMVKNIKNWKFFFNICQEGDWQEIKGGHPVHELMINNSRISEMLFYVWAL